MLTLPKPNLGSDVRVGRAIHNSKLRKFINAITNHEPHEMCTSVDIFSIDANRWYCEVFRGEQKARPMGRYTKRETERVQEARRTRIAAKGTAWLICERPGES